MPDKKRSVNVSIQTVGLTASQKKKIEDDINHCVKREIKLFKCENPKTKITTSKTTKGNVPAAKTAKATMNPAVEAGSAKEQPKPKPKPKMEIVKAGDVKNIPKERTEKKIEGIGPKYVVHGLTQREIASRGTGVIEVKDMGNGTYLTQLKEYSPAPAKSAKMTVGRGKIKREEAQPARTYKTSLLFPWNKSPTNNQIFNTYKKHLNGRGLKQFSIKRS